MSKRRRISSRATRKSTLSPKLSGWPLGGAVAVVVVAVGTWFLLSGGVAETPGIALPYYVRSASADVREAYAYAVEHPEVLRYIPCYCGCGHPDFGHQSNWNCFVRSMTGSDITFDDHGYT